MASTKVSSFHSTLQNFQTSQTTQHKNKLRNCSNFHSSQSSFGQNTPRFQPLTSVVQVVFSACDAASYPYQESNIYDGMDETENKLSRILYGRHVSLFHVTVMYTKVR